MSQVNNRKNKQSVNPAKNAAAINQSIEEKNSISNTKTIERKDNKEVEKVNDLDKNRLKNWKLRRELKKALNSDMNTPSKTKTVDETAEISKTNPKQKKVEKEEIQEQEEFDSTGDDKVQDIEQEYAPERMELFKQKVHAAVGKFVRKLSPYPVVKSVSKFWWGQLKKVNFKQAFVLVVSALIVFAFVVPPVWSAIESYRAGMWQLFG